MRSNRAAAASPAAAAGSPARAAVFSASRTTAASPSSDSATGTPRCAGPPRVQNSKLVMDSRVRAQRRSGMGGVQAEALALRGSKLTGGTRLGGGMAPRGPKSSSGRTVPTSPSFSAATRAATAGVANAGGGRGLRLGMGGSSSGAASR